jgi:hypothetical protein
MQLRKWFISFYARVHEEFAFAPYIEINISSSDAYSFRFTVLFLFDVQDDIAEDDDEDSSRIERDDATAAGGSRRVRKHHRRHSPRRRRRRTQGPRNDPLCVFRERHSMDGFIELQSAHNRSWFVAFGRSGLTRRVAVTAVDGESGGNALASLSTDLRRSCQFVKTNFAYVDDGSQFRGASAMDERHRTVSRGGGGGGVEFGHHHQQQQQQQHNYHGPSIDYRRIFAKFRSTATSASDGSSLNDRSPST